MTSNDHETIYDRIDALTQEEVKLRADLAAVRRKRQRLKQEAGIRRLVGGRPTWMENLPPKFWIPSYTATCVMNSLEPSTEYKNVPPDLADWKLASGWREFFVNIGLTVACVIVGLQLVFLIF